MVRRRISRPAVKRPAMLGVLLPIGAGAALRQSLGLAVVGGFVVSQALTLFTIPVRYLDRPFEAPRRRSSA